MLIDAVEWLGHSGFRIKAPGGHVYVDPYRVDGGPPADLILITHGHYDHFSPQDVERLSHKDTWLVGPPAVAERVSSVRRETPSPSGMSGRGTDVGMSHSVVSGKRRRAASVPTLRAVDVITT